jgi:hypothetical protein
MICFFRLIAKRILFASKTQSFLTKVQFRGHFGLNLSADIERFDERTYSSQSSKKQ